MTQPLRCKDLAPLIDELVDGALDDARARAVRAHARTCADCERRLAGTERLVEAAQSLEPIDPPAELWARIEERLDGDDAIEARRPRLWWWWHAWRKPILGGATLAACAVAFAIVLARRGGEGHETAPTPTQPAVAKASDLRPQTSGSGSEPEARGPRPEALAPMEDLYSAALREVERSEADYKRAIDDLRAIVADERPRWRSEVVAAFDENLAAIDAAVERQRLAVTREPANPAAVDALFASYRKKIDFLQETVIRGEVAR
jgi:hypothetical protein